VDQDFKLGPWVVRPTLNSVSLNGHSVRLEPKAMAVLVCLAQAGGNVVSKENLIAHVWDTFVGDDVLTRNISELRRALEDDAKAPRVIETIPKKGYRLLVKAEPVREPRVWAWRSALLVVGALVLFLAAIPLVKRIRVTHSVKQALLIKSLAVLPLENLSGDPAQEYFADGMTDEVITMLAKHLPLRVISRTSVMQYKNVHRPLPEIARELGVDGILEGSVGRTGNRVHMTAQLIYAPSDTHVWAESFDRDLSDVGALQNDLAQTIAKQVGATTSGLGSAKRQINPEAHDAYLLGRYYWFAEEHDKSRANFQKAIDLQPDYAAAWSGVSDSYCASAVVGKFPPEAVMPQAEAAAMKALELDDLSAEAHLSMAAIELFYRWNWPAAERESARAVELNPNFAEGHHLRSYTLRPLNRLDEALEEEKKAMELEPTARPWALVPILIRLRQFDAALNQARILSQAQPNNASLHYVLADAYFIKGMEKESEQESERYLQLTGEKDQLARQIQVYRRGGFHAVLEWTVDVLKRKAAREYVPATEFVDAYAMLGRKEETIHYLEKSYRERAPRLIFLQSNPTFDFLHSDPRYRAIINKMGLPPAY
jgi:TolB-like protein/DNA-binding winged helix-turn-helix (wHTH) protein